MGVRRRENEQGAPPSRRNPIRNRNADGTLIDQTQLLDMLRRLLAQHGYITLALINADASLPSATYFRRRLGNMLSAYKQIDYLHTKREVMKEAGIRRTRGTGRI
jgi:hypothetical protein